MKETPFWFAFGGWFDFQPVCTPHERIGNGEYFIFIAHRKLESLDWAVDETLMQRGDSTFETLLYMGIYAGT